MRERERKSEEAKGDIDLKIKLIGGVRLVFEKWRDRERVRESEREKEFV